LAIPNEQRINGQQLLPLLLLLLLTSLHECAVYLSAEAATPLGLPWCVRNGHTEFAPTPMLEITQGT
jgi:hypothetical protein